MRLPKMWRKTLGSLLLSAAFVSSSYALEPHTISATGRAEVQRKADVAIVTLYIKNSGKIVEELEKLNLTTAQNIKNELLQNFKSIRRVDVEFNQIGSKRSIGLMGDEGAPSITRRMRIVTSPDMSEIAKIIDRAIAKGAKLVEESGFSFRDEEGSVVYGLVEYQEALALAEKQSAEKARAQAERIAALVGRKVGAEISAVQCGGAENGCSSTGKDRGVPTSYFGSDPTAVRVTVSTTIQFELEATKR